MPESIKCTVLLHVTASAQMKKTAQMFLIAQKNYRPSECVSMVPLSNSTLFLSLNRLLLQCGPSKRQVRLQMFTTLGNLISLQKKIELKLLVTLIIFCFAFNNSHAQQIDAIPCTRGQYHKMCKVHLKNVEFLLYSVYLNSQPLIGKLHCFNQSQFNLYSSIIHAALLSLY